MHKVPLCDYGWTLDDDEDELARLMQDDLDDALHQDEEDACKAHTMDDVRNRLFL
jgi:hypothetical protein